MVFAIAEWNKLPSGLTNFYVNPGNGMAGWGDGNDSNDGLSPLTPLQHYNSACYHIYSNFAYGNGSQAKINGAPDRTDTTPIHFAAHGLVGAQGGAALIIEGGSNSCINPTVGSAAEFYNGSIVQVKNLKLIAPGGSCITVSHHGQAYIMDGVDLGACNGGQINVGSHGHTMLSGAAKVSGSAFALVVDGGGVFDGVGSFTFLNNVTYGGATVYGTLNSINAFGPITFNLNGKTVTGTRWLAGFNGTILSATGNPDTFFPGSVNGQEMYGGECV